jgi:hypothetical protein
MRAGLLISYAVPGSEKGILEGFVLCCFVAKEKEKERDL